MAYEKEIERVVSEISHQCDGPVTRFVLVWRAMQMVKHGECMPDIAAYALSELIPELENCDPIAESNEY